MVTRLQNPSLRDRLESFCRRLGFEALYVFGSRAEEIRAALNGERLRPKFESDVDIAVKLPRDRVLSVREKAEVAVGLEDLLGVDRIDLAVLAEADPFVAVNMIRGERLFCRDDYAADEYELYVLRCAGDLERYERLRIAQIMNSEKSR